MGIFELGPWAFGNQVHRNAGVLVKGDKLHVMWTRIGDARERIFQSTINLSNIGENGVELKGRGYCNANLIGRRKFTNIDI